MRLSKLTDFLIYLSVFIFSIYPYSDYDWGWHFQYGEYLFKHGALLRSDIFSWTLPGYQWVNHSWAFDPLLYLLFKLGGFSILMIVGALVGTFVFYLSIKFFNLSSWQKVLAALFYIELSWVVMSQSLRSQVLVLIFYPILILLLIFSKKNPKKLFFLPPLFLIWANFHGTFTIGLLVIGLFVITNFLIDFDAEKKKIGLYIGVGLLTFIATLINPYGYLPYFEAIRHFSNPWLANVLEWMPFFVFVKNGVQYYFIFYLLLLGLFFLKRRKLSDLPYLVILSVLAYLTIQHNRYISPFLATSLPILALFLEGIKISWDKFKMFTLILLLSLIISLELGWGRIGEFDLFKYSYTDYCRFATHCSEKMINYLTKNPPQGKGLNFYDWGGYLIGRGVPMKLFIDGRMHLWEKNGYMPFADYIELYYRQNYTNFKKYNFNWLLLRNDSPLVQDLATPNIFLGTWTKIFSDGEASYYIKR
jgi:hypothetical protein